MLIRQKVFSILALLLMAVSGAWAQTAPEGLSIDSDYSSEQEGYYYVNIQSIEVGQSITFTETDLTFKVYDDGGKNGNNGQAGYSLQLQAPDGYCFEVEGTFTLEDDVLAIYNSSWDDQKNQLYYFVSSQDGDIITSNISRRRTTGNYMFIKFFSQSDVKQAGFELTVRIKPLQVLRGEGTEENPYEVWSGEAWNDLCSKVAEGETFAGKYVKQMLDFEITQAVGTKDHAFSGHYDGGGHTMTCNLSASGEAVAPFYKVEGAEINNLHVTGTISGGIHTAGLVAFSSGSNRTTINNCRISATITCTGNDTNDAHGGGIIGHAEESEYAVTGCLFDGKLVAVTNGKGDTYIGAIAGWGGSGTRIIQTTFEKGIYEGADKSRIAFCWLDNNTYGPNSYGGNYYFSDLGNSYGAERLVSVASGTEGLEINFNYTWEDAYHGAMTKATSGIHTYFTIGDKFYTTSGGSASFRLAYPTDWNVTAIYSNGTEITGYEGLYTISNITASTSITATYSIMPVELILNDANSNEEALENYLGRKVNTLTLSGRTLYKDGAWNTLCLPFDVDNFTGTPLEGATVKTLASTSFEDGTLAMDFSDDVTSIEAGKPYIVKWAAGTDIENPVFNGVTISNAPANIETDYVDFIGTYSPVSIYTAEKTNLYLGDGNTLYYPTASNFKVNAFRGYFQLKQSLTAGETNSLSAGVRNFVLNFGDGETTGIVSAEANSSLFTLHSSLSEWYTLDGRKLDGQPTAKGLYIHGGKKVAIK